VATALAIYGGIVGTLALAWNVYTRTKAHRTRVRVELGTAVIAPPTGTEAVLGIRVVNDSAHEVSIVAAGVYTDHERQTIQALHRFGQIPARIPARDSASQFLPRDTPGLAGEVIGWARDAGGKVYRSTPLKPAA